MCIRDRWIDLPTHATVSMNLWGFSKSIMKEIGDGFQAFLDEGLKSNPLKCEYFIPSVVLSLIHISLTFSLCQL